MKTFLCTCGILASWLFYFNGQQTGQNKPLSRPSFEYENECGNPEVESMLWLPIEGTVVKIIDGDSVKLRINNGQLRIVNLVAIDASPAKEVARGLLSQMVLNRKVDVLVNPSKSRVHTLVGVLELDGKDVNSELLKAGAVKYQAPPPYSVSNYTACGYRIVERIAREAKKGMWQRSNP
jgi:endonuclease YncB( thermonuclease family)